MARPLQHGSSSQTGCLGNAATRTSTAPYEEGAVTSLVEPARERRERDDRRSSTHSHHLLLSSEVTRFTLTQLPPTPPSLIAPVEPALDPHAPKITRVPVEGITSFFGISRWTAKIVFQPVQWDGIM
jgi:hypothetical protein